MKNISLVFLLLCALAGKAQVSKYTFSQESGQPIEISNYPDIDLTEHIINDDNVWPAKIKIPFPFMFNGVLQDSLGISENGFIWFGSAQAGNLDTIVNPISDIEISSVKGIVSALGGSLHPHVNSALTTQLRSGVTGTGNSHMLIIEWKNTSRFDPVRAGEALDTISFQIKLYQLINRVEIAYMHVGLNKNFTTLNQVGLRGESNTDFNNRSTNSAGLSWSNTAKGTTKNTTCKLSETTFPSYGDMFVWMDFSGTGVNNINKQTVAVYPNPAKGVLYIENLSHTETQLTLMNVTGQLVYETTFTDKHTLAIQNYPKGLYLVQLKYKEQISTHKILID